MPKKIITTSIKNLKIEVKVGGYDTIMGVIIPISIYPNCTLHLNWTIVAHLEINLHLFSNT